MTDKIDVSKCDMFIKKGCECAIYYAELNADKPELEYGYKCIDNPNCYYKQLQQANKRIEELEEKKGGMKILLDKSIFNGIQVVKKCSHIEHIANNCLEAFCPNYDSSGCDDCDTNNCELKGYFEIQQIIKDGEEDE